MRCRDWQIVDPDDKGFKYYGALTMMASQLAYEDYTASPSVVHSVVNGCWQVNISVPIVEKHLGIMTTDG